MNALRVTKFNKQPDESWKALSKDEAIVFVKPAGISDYNGLNLKAIFTEACNGDDKDNYQLTQEFMDEVI